VILAAATISWIALIAWLATAGAGFVMLAIWVRRGGMNQQEKGRIRPPLILAHFLLAATGLVIWIIYVATDSEGLAWLAFAILVLVALLGWTMFFIWAGQRQRGPSAVGGTPASNPGGAESQPAEQHFPTGVIGLHGLLAITTVVLVFLAAIGVGE
jgi:hypothetical protein